MYLKLWIASFLLLSPALLVAQVVASARGGNQSLWAGAEFSSFQPDFGPPDRLAGFGAYADFNWNSRWGVEGEARFLRFNGFHGENESSYLAGPKVNLILRRKFKPYVKMLVGVGEITYPFQIGSGGYLAYAPGGGVDYRLNRSFTLRAEYEHQFWPGTPGIPGEPSHGLQPNGFSVGLAYRIF